MLHYLWFDLRMDTNFISGSRTLDTRHWTLASGLRTYVASKYVYSGLRTVDFELWTLNSGLWTLDFELGTLDSGLWTRDSGLGTLETNLSWDVFNPSPVIVSSIPEIRKLQRSIETCDLRYFPQHVLLWISTVQFPFKDVHAWFTTIPKNINLINNVGRHRRFY